ncbi:MAG: tRNA (guanosine(37)-N1)-methyltransferase TrmD [Actinomycetota bacterium]
MRFDVVTIFPEWFTSPMQTGLLGKAVEAGIIGFAAHDLRDWAPGPHRKVDDAPFGGGAGMVLAPGPVVEAVEAITTPGGRVVLLSAAGRPLTQAIVRDLATAEQLVLVCGRYEGMDDRIKQAVGAEEISIGEFVLAGGEVGAIAVIEAVSRLVPGVMGNEGSLNEESFASGFVEYPQYTRPAEFRGLKVPEVLLSGDHAKIAGWRREQSIRRTYEARRDYLENADLTEPEREIVARWQAEEGQTTSP